MTAVRRTDLTAPRLGDLAAVAVILGVTKDWLYRNRASLAAEHGFPAPVPNMPSRYDLVAVHLWLDRQIPAALRPVEGVEAGHAPNDITSFLAVRADDVATGRR